MLLTMIVAAMAVRQDTAVWTLSPTFDPKAPKEVWETLVDAQAPDGKHHATFNLTRATKSTANGKAVVSYSWEKLTVDDHDGDAIDPWDAVVGPRGQIQKMVEAEDSFRRMLSPMIFIYPEKPVTVGDKWSVDVIPADKTRKITYEYEAKGKETVGDTPTIIVDVKLTEGGADGIAGHGSWWLSKVGKVVKFEMMLNNWVVPMAGNDAITDVIIRGKAR